MVVGLTFVLIGVGLGRKEVSMLSLQENRRDQIARHVGTRGFASVSELADCTGYSVATVKRDLAVLERQGVLRRMRGGAVPVPVDKLDDPYFMKLSRTGAERNKEIVAALAQHMIHDDMTIVIDSSTTCLHLIERLSKFQGLHVITNGVVTAAMLSEKTNAEVCVLGGVVTSMRQTINGAKAYNDMLSYSADLALLSCRGFDFQQGASEVKEGEALIKQAMRRQSTEVALLAVADKIPSRFTYQSLRCSDIDCLVTDAELSGEELESLGQNNIEVFAPLGDVSKA